MRDVKNAQSTKGRFVKCGIRSAKFEVKEIFAEAKIFV